MNRLGFWSVWLSDVAWLEACMYVCVCVCIYIYIYNEVKLVNFCVGPLKKHTYTHIRTHVYMYIRIPVWTQTAQFFLGTAPEAWSNFEPDFQLPQRALACKRDAAHTPVYVCMNVCMYVYVCISEVLLILLCMHVCVCVYVCVYACMYACMYVDF